MTTTSRSTELRYSPAEIEAKWRERWAKDRLYAVRDDDPRPKWYEMTMFPYPSGDIHMGHWYAMAPSDAHARFRRMQGYNVLHPMGFDAFGLPAENAAIKRGVHPFTWTMANIEKMRGQLKTMGTIYDWDREVVTCTPEYYRWNQWLFLQFYKAGLAYRAFAPANWCPSCNTVLANEQVTDDGKCERCGTVVTRRELNQWFFRITKYAEELLDHSKIEWPEKINLMQTNWIGRSTGVRIDFDLEKGYGPDSPGSYGVQSKVQGTGDGEIQTKLTTFTTRIDTIYGVTFVVIAPEHPLVPKLTTAENRAAVEAYIEQARRQTEVDRMSTEKEKTGVPTGSFAVNKLTGERVPILVGDYVLLTYGTGVVMAVPAHDQRDFQFAKKYGLPVKVVIAPPEASPSPVANATSSPVEGEEKIELTEAFTGVGTMVASGQFNGLKSDVAKEQIAEYVESKGWGKRTVQYRMRDWLISRQRYWGTPIPIIYCPDCGEQPVPDRDLPVVLPQDAEFRPTGESPLALHQGFVNTKCPKCGKAARRETDTMDTFVDSSWYQMRYTSPHFAGGPFDPKAIKKWNPVDQYTGGAEHAVMHLLYARFFNKAMRDLGLIDFDEPFVRLFNQGHILSKGEKMSKSRGNVVAPDEFVNVYGADVVRCYLMFLGPWDMGGEWNEGGVNGMARWMNRVWEIASRDPAELDAAPVDETAVRELQRSTHKTVRHVTDDLAKFKFNTSLAALMSLTNTMNAAWEKGTGDGVRRTGEGGEGAKGVRSAGASGGGSVGSAAWRDSVEKLLVLLAPMAPHMAEEMWERTGHAYSIHNQPQPVSDAALAADDVITLVVQVNGKVRDRLDVPVGVTEAEARKIALESTRIQAHLEGKQVAKFIYVPGKLVNIVVR
ncbi:MAG: leucine--tRNA ligase [SAR202 cluster bacterium]|nr:leucine--tRNA ligase [SAR202 cluster bacterium]